MVFFALKEDVWKMQKDDKKQVGMDNLPLCCSFLQFKLKISAKYFEGISVLTMCFTKATLGHGGRQTRIFATPFVKCRSF